MPSSRAPAGTLASALSLALAMGAHGSVATAQQAYPAFLVDRMNPSPGGAGWFVMDTLDMHGGLGGDFALTFGYAHNPLRVSQGAQTLAVVSDQALVDFGAALTVDRFRFSMNFTSPLWVAGGGGMLGAYTVTAPTVDLAQRPDAVMDVRVGLDARLVGRPASPLRLGASAWLLVPSGNGTQTYDASDGTLRAMLRVLFAGDLGAFTYAGHVGVHIRPLDASPAPGAPAGSELQFGVAAGARFLLGPQQSLALVVGPEVYGSTALQSAFGSSTTALEAQLGARVEGTAARGLQARVKLGVGGGIDPNFGAPEWRAVVGVEVFNRDVLSAAPTAPSR